MSNKVDIKYNDILLLKDSNNKTVEFKVKIVDPPKDGYAILHGHLDGDKFTTLMAIKWEYVKFKKEDDMKIEVECVDKEARSDIDDLESKIEELMRQVGNFIDPSQFSIGGRLESLREDVNLLFNTVCKEAWNVREEYDKVKDNGSIIERLESLEISRKIHSDNYTTNNSHIHNKLRELEGSIEDTDECHDALVDKVDQIDACTETEIHCLLRSIESNTKSCSNIFERLEKLESEIKPDILVQMKQYADLCNKIDILFNRVNSLETYAHKKPHKCPVCDGKGVEFDRLNRGQGFNSSCKSCEGKRIVWG